MAENGTEQRRCALDDEHAAIDALCEAENAVLAAEDAHKEAISARLKAHKAHSEAEKDLNNPEIPLEEALERARVAAIHVREADAAVIGEDGTLACLNEAKDARDEAFDEMIKRKDHLRGLLDDYDEKREAKAEDAKPKAVNPVVETNSVLNREDREDEAAPEELYDSDWFMWKVATSILDRTTSGREMIPWKTLEAEMRKTLNEQRAKYPTLDERLIVNWDHAKASLERLHRREMLICEFGGHAVWVKYDPQFVEEPDPGFPEEGKCLNDVDNPNCLGVTTKGKHGKWKGKHYPRCKPCNDIFQERRDAKPVKPEPVPKPDDSGTLLSWIHGTPEPAPAPVPASTVMLDAKPVADDLAVLLRKGKVDEFLASAGHWYSTRFTRGLVLRLKADRAAPSVLQVFWMILTVLEGLDKDETIIDCKSIMALSGMSDTTVQSSRRRLNEFGYITWDGKHNDIGIGPKVSDIIEDDTTDGKEHWHSTKYTLAVAADLVAEGVKPASRNMFWAILTTLEGLGIESGEIPQRMITETIGAGPKAPQVHVPALSELGWITHKKGRTDLGSSRAALATYGFGPRLTNE